MGPRQSEPPPNADLTNDTDHNDHEGKFELQDLLLQLYSWSRKELFDRRPSQRHANFARWRLAAAARPEAGSAWRPPYCSAWPCYFR